MSHGSQTEPGQSWRHHEGKPEEMCLYNEHIWWFYREPSNHHPIIKAESRGREVKRQKGSDTFSSWCHVQCPKSKAFNDDMLESTESLTTYRFICVFFIAPVNLAGPKSMFVKWMNEWKQMINYTYFLLIFWILFGLCEETLHKGRSLS